MTKITLSNRKKYLVELGVIDVTDRIQRMADDSAFVCVETKNGFASFPAKMVVEIKEISK